MSLCYRNHLVYHTSVFGIRRVSIDKAKNDFLSIRHMTQYLKLIVIVKRHWKKEFIHFDLF